MIAGRTGGLLFFRNEMQQGKKHVQIDSFLTLSDGGWILVELPIQNQDQQDTPITS